MKVVVIFDFVHIDIVIVRPHSKVGSVRTVSHGLNPLIRVSQGDGDCVIVFRVQDSNSSVIVTNSNVT